jgi:hypothetical protein
MFASQHPAQSTFLKKMSHVPLKVIFYRIFLRKSNYFILFVLKLSLIPHVHGLKNVKIAEKVLKLGQFLQILATFYQFFKSRFEKSW